jgi:porin
VFARVLGAPADRNLLDFYVDMGIKVAGFTASRPEDSFGLALGWARISRDARAADRDASGAAPVRDHEAVVEGTYTTTLRPGWTLQPDLQYIIHPGGSRAQRNAWVVGLRTALHY